MLSLPPGLTLTSSPVGCVPRLGPRDRRQNRHMSRFEPSERISSDYPRPKGPVEGWGLPSRTWSFDGAHWDRLSSAVAWFINLVSVFYITRYLFGLNSVALYWGWDPQSMLTFIAGRHVFSDIIFGLGSDPIIGLGNISYPVNPLWFPSYTLTANSFGIIEDKPLSFAIGATELFAATVLCGRLNGFSIARSMTAGWLITLTTWQLFGLPKIVTIWFFFPHHAEVLSLSVLTACAALRLGDVSVRRPVLLSIAIFLGISYIVLADATSLILAVPVIGAFAMSRLILSSSRAERLQIVLCWAAIGVAVLAVYAGYLAGLLSYTAASQFPDLSKRVATAFNGEISLFLWTPITSYMSVFTPERTMLGAALIGALFAIWRGSLKQRRLGLGVLLGQAMFTTVGVTNYWLNYWFGPTIWYFELFLFPYYSLCVCFLVFLPLAAAARWISWPLRQPLPTAERLVVIVLPVAIVLYTPTVARPARSAETESVYAFSSPLPQPETAITRILKSEIPLVPGQPFRGRVANLTGAIFPQEREWQRYSLVHYFAQLTTGNLHDGPGLWQDQIPTLLEYSTLVTPAYFALLRVFLTHPTDIVTRNIIGTRRIDLRILRLLGIRFIITDVVLSGARLRAEIKIPTPLKSRQLLGYAHLEMESFQLYLYELDEVNVGQFSPI